MHHATDRTEQPAAVIKVVGVGGSGGQIVSRLSAMEVPGAEIMAMGIRSYELSSLTVPHKVQLREVKGIIEMSSSYQSHIQSHVRESGDIIEKALRGAHMVILTAGMGGNNSVCVGSVVAEIAGNMDIPTLCVVSTPYSFEGVRHMQHAREGIATLLWQADGVLVFPNNQLRETTEEKITLRNAFELCDIAMATRLQYLVQVLHHTGFPRADPAEIRQLLHGAGLIDFAVARHGSGDVRQAAGAAVISPLLQTGIWGARRILLHITAPPSSTPAEIDAAFNFMKQAVSADTQIVCSACHSGQTGCAVQITALAVNADAPERVEGLCEIFDLGGPRDIPVSLAAYSRKRAAAKQEEAAAQQGEKTAVDDYYASIFAINKGEP